MKKIIILVSLFMILCTVSYAGVEVPETVRIKLNDDSIIEIDLDEYLYGVVNSEMGTTYKDDEERKDIDIEALKAQAVASRTYAVYKINSSSNEEYDMTATTSDQVYKAGDVKDIVKEAVDSTSGQVMTYDDEVICAYFFSTSGGHTEVSENVWSSALPYLKAVEDPYEPYIEGKSEWEARISADKYGEIEILERNENDRVYSLQIGDEVYTKNNIRMKLGASLIKSTWFDVEYDEDTNEYVFTGKGYGHGVGMSQHGAMGMAEAGFDYMEILNWYYNDIEFEPNDEQYIIVDEEIEEDDIEIDEEDSEADDMKIKDKEYNSSNVTIKDNDYGPLLTKALEVIKSINSWR